MSEASLLVNYFFKYERLSQVATDEESLHEIDRPINVQKREETFQSFNREIPGSRTFRRWVAEHGEEIDECKKCVRCLASLNN